MSHHLNPATKAKLICLLALISVTLLSTETYAHSASVSQASGRIIVGEPVSPQEFRGDLRQLPKVKPSAKSEQRSPLSPSSAIQKYPRSNFTGSALQPQPSISPMSSMPSSTTSFQGLDFTTWGAGWPPDPVGDVGPNHYIQAVNTSVGIFDKTGTLLSAFTFDDFWTGANTGTACDGNISSPQHRGDPLVLYDPLADRWIFADFAWTNTANGPYYECLAVSAMSDPVSGGWWLYAIRTDDDAHPYLADYPKIGLWPDGIYMSANMFDLLSGGGETYEGVRVWALNRNDMESGAAVQSLYVDLNTSYFSLLPSNLRGNSPPSGSPNYFVSNDFNVFQLDVWKFSVDWGTPGNSTFTGPFAVTTSAYTLPPATVPEQGGEGLDALDDRLMMQNQYRNISGTESLWLTHTAGSGGVTGIRWYQLDITGGTVASSPVQSGTYQPDSDYRWLPSLAVDQDGNMAMGYSISSSSMYPAIRYAGRLASDPVNTLGQGETTLIAGTGAQSGGFGRWGDYSAMSVDPNDDCTFWYTNEYYETTGSNWQTRIGSFKFDSCGSPATSTPTPGTPTATLTRTNTPIPPTGTPTRTNTPVPSTATPTSTRTNTPVPPTSTYTPVPGAKHIVFVSPKPETGADSNVWIMDPDGSNETQLTTWNGDDVVPVISPNGAKVAYYSRQNNSWTLWVMNSDGTNPVQLPLTGDNSGGPAWSPDGSQIAFSNDSQDGWEIWVVNADGSNPHRLTTHGPAAGHPSWSPDGQKLVYGVNPSTNYLDLYTVNSDGTGQSLLVSSGTGYSNYAPAWSPDGTQIATIHWPAGSSGPYDLWVMNADGSNGQTLVQNIDDVSTNNLAWSTDSNWLVFAKGGQIWRVKRDGTGLTQITTASSWQPDTNADTFSDPTPTPTPTLSSNAIVYARPAPTSNPWQSDPAAGDSNIWIINPDGSNPTELTTSTNTERLPGLSLDGSKIVYQAVIGSRCTMWVMNRDGTNPVQLQVNGTSSDCGKPAWSPDGSQLAFSSNADGFWEIWLMNADGSNPHQLSHHPGAAGEPSWSPDGQKLVYEVNPATGYEDIYTINTDGTGQTLLVSSGSGFSHHYPAWSPDGTHIATIYHAVANWFTGPYDLWLMNADGSNGHVILQNIDHPHDNNLSWSGDSNWLVFSKGGQIWRIHPDGTGLTQITTTGGWQPHTNADTFNEPTPTPTPTQTLTRTPTPTATRTRTNTPVPPTNTPTLGTQHIVFTRPQSPSDGSVDTDVWIMNPDGSNQTQLTNFIGEDRQPAISPNGSKIAYYSRRNGLLTLWVMNSNGTNPIQFSMGADTQTAAWSPDSSKIAFANNTVDWWEIWTSNPDGSNPQRLTTHAGASVYPNWAPSGNKLVYVNEPSARYYDLYTVNTDGTGQSLLLSASATGFSNHGPAWSPDGTQIATIRFPAGSWTGPYDLWLMDANGSNGHVLVQGIGEPLDNNLSWSGDGTWILFSKNSQIWRIRRDGTGLTQITTTGGWEPDTNAYTFSGSTPTAPPTLTRTNTPSGPTSTPTRTNTPVPPTPTSLPFSAGKIVFTRPEPPIDGSRDADIWIMNPDGSNQTQLTTWTGEDRQPAISPDGSKIAYNSRRNNLLTLWVMNSDGTNPIQLSLAGETQSPAWSPDSSKIAFGNISVDWWEIWIANADGSNPQRLTTHPGASVYPDWAPSGNKLVYVNEPSARYYDLYTVNTDGTGQSLLVSASATGFSNHQPAWSPDGTQIATIRFPAGSWIGPYDLWLMNADGSKGHVLVQNIDDPHTNSLAWSADGNWLVFNQNDQIWRIRRDGTGLTQITTTGGWEPDTNANFSSSFQVYLPMVANNYCGPLYADDFSRSASGWFIGDSGDTLWQYLTGEYRLLVRSTYWASAASTPVKFSNYIVAADVRNASGAYGTYGLLFGLADNWSQFYSFEVDPTGMYLIWRYNAGSWTLLTWGTSGAIHGGTATNRLKLERNGSLIKAYANDQLLTIVSDGSYTGSRLLGLEVTTYDQPNVDIRFDNFKVYPLSCGSIGNLNGSGQLSSETTSTERDQTSPSTPAREGPNLGADPLHRNGPPPGAGQ